MKNKEVSPTVAIIVIVIVFAVVAGFYYMRTRPPRVAVDKSNQTTQVLPGGHKRLPMVAPMGGGAPKTNDNPQ